ncbi:Transcription initiation factor TFIID subunit 10 [Thoreauomyces humboldtii]|nr:Transcription initiation factor TFIID subunit 10 [Thoreauomyces humboldtii]
MSADPSQSDDPMDVSPRESPVKIGSSTANEPGTEEVSQASPAETPATPLPPPPPPSSSSLNDPMETDKPTTSPQKQSRTAGQTSDESEEETPEDAAATTTGKPTRQDRETVKKDRSLAELLLMMDEYKPVIPDAVTDYYLSRSGFACSDVRVSRLLALAAQKFVSDVAMDALQYSKTRGQAATSAKDRRSAADRAGGAAGGKEKRTVLIMEDLSAALSDHGVNVKKPEYHL